VADTFRPAGILFVFSPRQLPGQVPGFFAKPGTKHEIRTPHVPFTLFAHSTSPSPLAPSTSYLLFSLLVIYTYSSFRPSRPKGIPGCDGEAR